VVRAVFGSLDDDAIDRLREFQLQRVKKSTQAQYAGFVVNFLLWADDLDIPLHLRFPTPDNLLLLFFSSISPYYAEATLNKFVSGLKLWHAIHGLPWSLDRVQGRTIRQAFKNISLDPLNLRRPIRIDDFKAMRAHMDPHDPGDAAIYACVLFAMWSMSRHGELTVRTGSDPPSRRARHGDFKPI
ncbi:unnamed protein product, partial [Tilletia controversa]